MWQKWWKQMLALKLEFSYNYYLHTKGATNNG